MSSLFGGSRGPNFVPQDQESRKNLLKQQVQQQLATLHAQDLVTKMNERCYAKCIYKPSTSLSSSDEACLSRCVDRWIEAFNIVSRTYVARLAKEKDNAADPLAAVGLNDKPEFI